MEQQNEFAGTHNEIDCLSAILFPIFFDEAAIPFPEETAPDALQFPGIQGVEPRKSHISCVSSDKR